jgi:hypothetical protein
VLNSDQNTDLFTEELERAGLHLGRILFLERNGQNIHKYRKEMEHVEKLVINT